jgi:di/tricarboxylate transporter
MAAGTQIPPSQIAQEPELVAHERTYKVFNILLRWSMLLLGDAILSLTIWFATPGGFPAALAVGLVVFVIGYLVLIRREEHQPLDVWALDR